MRLSACEEVEQRQRRDVARSLEYGLAFEHVISARHLHKTLVVRARYEFANLTSRTIAYAQEDGPEHVLQPGEVRPVCVTRVRSRALAALGVRAPAWFRVRFDEPGWEASGAFPLDFAGTATLSCATSTCNELCC